MTMLETLRKSTFEPHLNSVFTLLLEDEALLPLTLVEVSTLHGDPGAARAPFCILFEGPQKPVLVQGIYPLQHAQLEPMSLFLVPVGPGDQCMRYEAIFN